MFYIPPFEGTFRPHLSSENEDVRILRYDAVDEAVPLQLDALALRLRGGYHVRQAEELEQLDDLVAHFVGYVVGVPLVAVQLRLQGAAFGGESDELLLP